MESLGRILIIIGLIVAAIGVLFYSGFSIPYLGRLPGDIRIERPGVRFYFPITSCIVVSVVVSVLVWIFSKIR